MTETALTTALNMSYMATQLSLFSIVIGVALLLAGIGFAVLDWAALHERRAEAASAAAKPLPTRQAGSRLRLPAWKPGKGGARSDPRPHHCQARVSAS